MDTERLIPAMITSVCSLMVFESTSNEYGRFVAVIVSGTVGEQPEKLSLVMRPIFTGDGPVVTAVRDRYQPFTITYARWTLAGWLSAVLGAGLVIEAIAEPCADEQTAATHPQVADTRIAPYFLIVRARKP